jgi:hypothetical protein
MHDALHAFDGRYASSGNGSRSRSGKSEFQESAPAGIRLVASGINFILTSRTSSTALFLIIVLGFCAHYMTSLM